MITKLLVSAAIALGSSVGAAAPASANPNPIAGTDPNPFGALSCSCQETAPAGSPALREEDIERGIRAGLLPVARTTGTDPAQAIAAVIEVSSGASPHGRDSGHGKH